MLFAGGNSKAGKGNMDIYYEKITGSGTGTDDDYLGCQKAGYKKRDRRKNVQ